MRFIRMLSLTTSFMFALTSAALANPFLTKATKPPVHNEYQIQHVKGSKLLSNLIRRLHTSKETAKFPVIITYKTLNAKQNVQASQSILSTFTPTYVYKNIPSIAAKLTKSQINKLATSPDVSQIEYDEPVHAYASQLANYWYGTQQARTDFNIDGDMDGNPTTYSKSDVTVAIIDTGIDASHVDLNGGKVIGWKDFVNNKPTPYDDNGHGTHVSSIAAGTGAGNPDYRGVAPGAALVGAKVLDANGSGSNSGVIAGIDWVIQNKNTYGIRVLNLSLGTNGSSDGTDATSLAVNRAADAGIVPAVAAGNSGPATKTVGSPGAAAKALTVGAMADPSRGGFNLAYFSSRGTTADGRVKPDIAAPGYQIMAAKANSTNQYIAYSGTSMATPFIAGTAALLIDANPTLTPIQVANIITSTADDFGPAGKENDYGSGNLNGYNAIKKAGNFTGNGAPLLPNHLFGQGTINTSKYKDEWTFNVTNTQTPISITFIMPDWNAAQDFDIYLLDPTGAIVGKGIGTNRQETISFTPTKTGKYTLRATSYVGTGSYNFDISTQGSGLIQTINDKP